MHGSALQLQIWVVVSINIVSVATHRLYPSKGGHHSTPRKTSGSQCILPAAPVVCERAALFVVVCPIEHRASPRPLVMDI
jgi:hypothetical protein